MSEINNIEQKQLTVVDTVVIRHDDNLGTIALSRWSNGIITQGQYQDKLGQPLSKNEDPEVIWKKIKNTDLPDASELLRLIDLYKINPLDSSIPDSLYYFLEQIIRRMKFEKIKGSSNLKGNS